MRNFILFIYCNIINGGNINWTNMLCGKAKFSFCHQSALDHLSVTMWKRPIFFQILFLLLVKVSIIQSNCDWVSKSIEDCSLKCKSKNWPLSVTSLAKTISYLNTKWAEVNLNNFSFSIFKISHQEIFFFCLHKA